ncbi:gluconolactonase [Spirosoma aureum]|uniref:Gluconolactonase n=1 Tax=Spirosoma aureum TaxID=2692134 RepID=A0A6G9AJ91_9BACT|nr:SMP-30/gluconolactonase/LRE family protein [Spirosoma aureum]QIP12520.1 gluconolactonase [Spirosoma aureum]
MKKLFSLLFLLGHFSVVAQPAAESYPIDSASIEQAGVPKGEVMKFTFQDSKRFPGTWREYWIYVPAQYRPDKPACVYVNQDGIQWKAPTVFDNLIHRKEMPVTIGVFVMPGKVRVVDGDPTHDRLNRSFEYDGLGEAYARFILDEILPDVEKQKTSDGRSIRLSKSGNDRAIGGSSSGAVCAFTAAWEHPEAFSRVFSAIGTYVGLRGGDRYATLIRKYEPKPIRVFLQDGTNDLNNFVGDWWKANETIDRALIFAGYEVQHVWGEGGHSGQHGTAIFPKAMRWLWKDYPKPVTNGQTKNPFLLDILLPNEGWELVGEGYSFTEGPAANEAGEVVFQDVLNGKTFKVDQTGKPVSINTDSKKAAGTAYSTSGQRYTVSSRSNAVYRYDRSEKETVVAEGLSGNDITVAKNGNLYITSPDGTDKPSTIYLIRPDGQKVVVDGGEATTGLKFANGLAFTPDQRQLYVAESASHWIWAYQVLPDGQLTHKQRYGWLHVPDTAENAWPDGLKCDSAGRVYVATRLGIQVLDQTGRVNAIIPTPTGYPSNLCFGGKNFDTLYVTCGAKVYRRKLKVRGPSPN